MQLPMTRTATLKTIFRARKTALQKRGIGYFAFERICDGWHAEPICFAGEAITGGVLTRGNVIHVAFEKPPKASVRGFIRRHLKPLVEKFGSAITCIELENQKAIEFDKRLGFEEFKRDNEYVYLEIRKMRHE
jgi:hypothetical protein